MLAQITLQGPILPKMGMFAMLPLKGYSLVDTHGGEFYA